MAAHALIFLKMIGAFCLSSTLSFFFSCWQIRRERKKQIGQYIKDDIVPTHQKKGKTPTMGGISIFLSCWITACLFIGKDIGSRKVIALFLISLTFFLIGLIDDLLKIKFHNGKGLPAYIRFFSEIAVLLCVLLFLGYEQQSRWQIHLNPNFGIHVGLFFLPLLILIVVGGANAVNMTDGLDGLASGLSMMACAPFLMSAIYQKEYGIAFFLVSMIGGCLGFLFYNFHPAKIFMGDCGSLPLGATLALSSFILKNELLLAISGALFVIETVSVILQVGSFKLTHHRIFKMAPLHHHFEMKGVAEWKVVMAFYIAGFLFSLIATIVGVME